MPETPINETKGTEAVPKEGPIQKATDAISQSLKALTVSDVKENKAPEPKRAVVETTEINSADVQSSDLKSAGGKPLENKPGLARMKKLEVYSDLKLRVGTGSDKKEYAVHKMILLGHSPRFESDQAVITLSDIDADTFEKVLEFLYMEKLPPTSSIVETAELYVAANSLEMTGLRLEAVTDFCNKVGEKQFLVKPSYEEYYDEHGQETEALKKYDGDKQLVKDAFLEIFEAYNANPNDILPYSLSKILDALKAKGLLGMVLDQPEVRRFFKGNAEASFAVLTFYRGKDFKKA